ncbi:tetratricopeptide repeat-containing protein [Bradyrhizobium sp. YCK136]|uniref:tetratricopeptide repeat-containing protein n=1 Tax=Bradyrhizobium sp. YCK136 TaxID=3351346 RepID=UPI0037C91C34
MVSTMPDHSRLRDSAVVALAGRRVDAADANPSRFPLQALPTVRRRLADLLDKEHAVAVVCSAACGADLVALEEAERLGLRRRIVLPFPPDRFRDSSVTDRPGDWGPLFDRLIAAAAEAGDLVVLSGKAGSEEAAYAAANEAIIHEAQTLAQTGAPHRLVAAVVWEGSARPGSDATAQFRELAVNAGFEGRFILTRSVVREAKDYLKGAALTPEPAKDLVKRLKSEDRFGWARRVLAKVRKADVPTAALRTWFAQQHAVCTYKDPDLPVLQALDRALAILDASLDLANTTDQETLGIAGAIHKRRWKATGQKDQLERSYHYYRRGYDVGPEKDSGYTAINAAFVLDQLADIEMADGAPLIERRRAEATEIRKAIVKQLTLLRDTNPKLKTDWWYLVTVAEALFGLGREDEAERWLLDAKAVPDVPDWELRSTATQLATLNQLQHRGKPSPDDPAVAKAAKVLDAFLDSPAARESAFIGKVGLALSGGGFRASLFHIGVLAKLAELDVLRRVEVLSCVSGGSIIGAHYYLQLRETLETTKVESLSEDEIRLIFIGVVQRVARDFLAGVQTNIRMRVFADPLPLLRSTVSRTYTRTVRLGELLESQLFTKVWADATKERRPDSRLLLKDLRIRPKDAGENFDPKIHNWRRKAKVPVLILNATTLNTGHAWQYTASFMGESPWAIDPNADGTNRLRRVYHDEAPPAHRAIQLGQAVVASACVPGLFEPVRLDGLYELEEKGKKAEPLVVRHVDGGVHDNQGLAGLIEQDCSVVLVSDASGQTALAVDPGGGTVAPLMRSNSVLMQRVRQEQYAHLNAMQQGGLLKGAMFIHLKQDLDVVPVDWIGCEEPPDTSMQEHEPLTEYGIRKEVQELLAGIRTDLDSFSDVEAFALMTSGYRMTEHYLPKVEALPTDAHRAGDWNFLAIERVLRDANTTDASYKRLVRLLRSAGSRMFRIWSQSRVVLLGTLLLTIVGGALIGAWLFNIGDPSQFMVTVNGWALLAAIALAVPLASPWVREHVSRISIGLLGLVLWVPAQFHLLLVDRAFLWMGRLDRLR